MYEKPRLERYGDFRTLTRIGCGTDGDGGLQGPIAASIGVTGAVDGTWQACFGMS